MNYPVWERALTGGGLLIAVMAVLHVYIAHFAVGGGFFLVVTEWMGYRRRRPEVVAYVKSHTLFFLLVTMVLGAVTGVGIWITISLLAPGVTSLLIHQFVFAWATEWVFFSGEIIALFLYWYRFDRMRRRDHLVIGGFYLLFGWLSLFMVNGIISFMLTPGDWIESGRSFDGFFNPSMWPVLGYRTCIAWMIAGIFGLLTAVFCVDRQRRNAMVGWSALWTVSGFALSCPFLYWTFQTLPAPQRDMILARSPELADATVFFGFFSVLLLSGVGVLMVRARERLQQATAIVVLLAGLGYMGGFEWLREGARRPWLIVGHTWANGITADPVAAIRTAGLLKSARWVHPEEAAGDDPARAGRALFRLQCAGCHAVGGPANDILPLTRHYSVFGMDAQLSGQGWHSAYMPPFMGTTAERLLLARFIVETLQGRKTVPKPVTITAETSAIPPFDPHADEYVLLAASTRGMHTFSGAPDVWTLRGTVAATLRAQLIRRGETPQIVTGDVTLACQVPEGQGNAGPMRYSDDLQAWIAGIDGLSPVDPTGRFRPYPLVTIQARQNDTLLAQTRVTLPQTTELGCGRCHGPATAETTIGLSRETALNVLRAHDRRSRTDLVDQVQDGSPVICTTCHTAGEADPRRLLDLSAAIHAFHAVYLADSGDEGCTICHAATETGATRFYRGVHQQIGLTCVNCHGDMLQMAGGLLMAESERDKPAARRIRPWLVALSPAPQPPPVPRRPWDNLPECLGCHVDFGPPETDTLPMDALSTSAAARFNNRADDAGIQCISCHGSPHALYPATNPYGPDRDNLTALQFQGLPYPIGANGGCRVCHTVEMAESIHHFDTAARFRNTR